MPDNEDLSDDQFWRRRLIESRRRQRIDGILRPLLLGISGSSLGYLIAHGVQQHDTKVLVGSAFAAVGVLGAAAVGVWRG